MINRRRIIYSISILMSSSAFCTFALSDDGGVWLTQSKQFESESLDLEIPSYLKRSIQRQIEAANSVRERNGEMPLTSSQSDSMARERYQIHEDTLRGLRQKNIKGGSTNSQAYASSEFPLVNPDTVLKFSSSDARLTQADSLAKDFALEVYPATYSVIEVFKNADGTLGFNEVTMTLQSYYSK